MILIHCDNTCAQCGALLYHDDGETMTVIIKVFGAISPFDLRPGTRVKPVALTCWECGQLTELEITVTERPEKESTR